MAEKQKILIVDDDANIAELIELYLTKEEFLVLNSEIKNIISKYKEKREKTDIYHMFSICAKGEIK